MEPNRTPTKYVIIGTAGHVDHGKSTLIRALTGTDPDRLAEEKARGMTIDLGFAALPLAGGIFAGVVDVPGHERFVKNMLAGTGGVDVALLVVAVDSGPAQQTREHLDIVTVLGIRSGVVALTKIDIADAEMRETALLLTRDALRGSALEDAPIVQVAAETGAGLPLLRAQLADVAARAPHRDAAAPFRLPVDRVFSLPGIGTVVTGTVIAGSVRAGDALVVQPQNLLTRARTLQTHNDKIATAEPGMRVAVNLPGIEVGQIERGSVLTTTGNGAGTELIDVRLSLLPDAPRPLAHQGRVRLHLGTGELITRVLLITGNEIPPGDTEIPAQLLCEKPTFAVRGDRFVIRTYSPARAIGGGIVVDPAPARRYRRSDPAALALFAATNQTDSADKVYAILASRPAEMEAAEIATATDLGIIDATVALESLVSGQRAIMLTNNRYLSDLAGERLRETARRVVGAYHRQNPLRLAMPRDGLRAPLAKAAAADFAAVLTYLVAQNVLILEGSTGVRLPDHAVVLPPGWQDAADTMLSVYRSSGLQPPAPGNFQANYPRHIVVRAILDVLVEQGHLVRIADDLYLSAETLARTKETMRRLVRTPDGITVATLRDATKSSRKIILPLLEYLDSQRFTQRQGDLRVLMEPSA